jgi:hypothetical protein
MYIAYMSCASKGATIDSYKQAIIEYTKMVFFESMVINIVTIDVLEQNYTYPVSDTDVTAINSYSPAEL